MHVRVRGLVEVAQNVEDLTRLLGAGGRVEVRERLAVDLLLEDGKIRAQLLRVEGGWSSRHGHVAIVPRRPPVKLRATALIALAILPFLAGCGGSGSHSSAPGAKVFASAGCGS